MNRTLKNRLEEIVILCQNYKVKSLYLMGGVNTKDELDDYEEIDLLIDFHNVPKGELPDKMFQMTYLFEKLLQHKVVLFNWQEAEYLFVATEGDSNTIVLYQHPE